MSLRRTFLARMPSDAGTMPYLDILLEGPVGSPTTPVEVGATAVGSAPPSGWQSGADFSSAPGGVGDGAFCEWGSKPLRVPTHQGGTGFVPLLRNGFSLSVVPSGVPGGGVICTGAAPPVLLSRSLTGSLTGDFSAMAFADPTYGSAQAAVIRLGNTVDVAGGLYFVSFEVQTQRDADRVSPGS
jgi:hypothetical protein